MTNNTVYIVDCLRTAIGSKNKSLKNFEAHQLAAFVIDALLKKTSIEKDAISEVVIGNAVSAGTGQNLARRAVALSGLSSKTPAYVVNNVCGSGLQAVIAGIQKILSEEEGSVIAGASESATHSPLLLKNKEAEPKESILEDGLFCALSGKSMGDICDELAQRNKISRLEQDGYTLLSHKRACEAREKGLFDAEIVPIDIDGTKMFDKDERPKTNTSLEKLENLPSAFSSSGTVTAGNASSAADGACAFVLASEEDLKKHNLLPQAKVLGYASIAVEPTKVFEEGVAVIKTCLDKCDLKFADIDLFEITEAFSAQAVFTINELGVSEDKVNVYGGDVALGHPLGIAGSRALVTLIHALKNNQKKRGLVYTAFGAGGAIAMAVEIL